MKVIGKALVAAAMVVGASSAFAQTHSWDSDWAGGPYHGQSPAHVSVATDMAGWLAALPLCTQHQIHFGERRILQGGVYFSEGYWDATPRCRVGAVEVPVDDVVAPE